MGSGVLRLWAKDIDTYMTERVAIVSRWETAKENTQTSPDMGGRPTPTDWNRPGRTSAPLNGGPVAAPQRAQSHVGVGCTRFQSDATASEVDGGGETMRLWDEPSIVTQISHKKRHHMLDHVPYFGHIQIGHSHGRASPDEPQFRGAAGDPLNPNPMGIPEGF